MQSIEFKLRLTKLKIRRINEKIKIFKDTKETLDWAF